MPLIEDSDRRCPHCSKRMTVDIGQEDHDESYIGWVVMVHSCWSCGYVERDRSWKRPRLVVLQGGQSGAERLKELRMGREIPLYIDPTPFPASEFDEEPADVS